MQKVAPLLAVIALAFVSLAFTFVQVDTSDAVLNSAVNGTADVSGIAFVEDGEEIYMTRCQSCHVASGEGIPGVFPPLNESEYVTGDKGRLIRMILNGLSGEIEVKGVTYSGMMPPWGAALDDDQIAKVLTFIRGNFGNEADAVTADEVAKVRAKVADKKDTWTMKDFENEENLGIPEK